VLENLKRSSAMRGRTTVIIAHRLATVRNADRIIVMKDGAVEEEGRHETLIHNNGVYAELVRAQQFDKGEGSAAPSSQSTSRSVQKERRLSETSTKTSSSDEVPTPIEISPTFGAWQLISRCIAVSRQEYPAIIIGLICSMFSGAVIIGEVSLPSLLLFCHYNSCLVLKEA
jgi:ATP-binding cassette subfamily B (MDR/TAP) protein 1